MSILLFLLIGTGMFFLVMLILAAVFAGGVYLVKSDNQGRIDGSRRSFLTGRKDDHAVFFGIQLVVQVFGGDELRARLAALVAAEDETDSTEEKRRFIKSVASLLIENQYAWEYGYWDFQGEADSAISNFNQWRNEIEASMATEGDELGSEIDRVHRFSDQKEFLIVSLMMLIDNREEHVEDDIGDYQFRPTYAQLTQPFRTMIESLPEAEYWRPATFKSLLQGLQALDPRAIERDGIYVYPGTEQDGLSSLDLIGEEGWKYLTDHSLRY